MAPSKLSFAVFWRHHVNTTCWGKALSTKIHRVTQPKTETRDTMQFIWLFACHSGFSRVHQRLWSLSYLSEWFHLFYSSVCMAWKYGTLDMKWNTLILFSWEKDCAKSSSRKTLEIQVWSLQRQIKLAIMTVVNKVRWQRNWNPFWQSNGRKGCCFVWYLRVKACQHFYRWVPVYANKQQIYQVNIYIATSILGEFQFKPAE